MLMTSNGMTLRSPARHHFTLRYDHYFFVHLYENNLLALSEILDHVKTDFSDLPACDCCDLIDADTGEVLFEVYKT